MSSDRILAAVAALRAIHDELDACDFDALSASEAVTVLDALQESECRTPAHRHRGLAQLLGQTTALEMGAKSWRDVLMIRWRLSTKEAGLRLTHATLLGPRRTVVGEPLPPTLEAVAVAQRLGFLTGEHVELLRKGIARLPGWVDQSEHDQIEVDWVRHGVGDGPKALRDQIERTLYELDQDGPPPDDEERHRRRAAQLGPQHTDGLSELTATLTPRARAVWEVLFAKFAAPGMCNPADEHPCVCGTPSQTQIDADTRTPAQRQHDVLEFIGRRALDRGELGHLNGLPTSILIRTSLSDLMTMTGTATTGGGTSMPIKDVVQLAAEDNATSYLGVFDDATNAVLDFYRARRTASNAQRLAIILRDGGCTKPGCPVHAYGTQVHHTVLDWRAGGRTNVNEMSLACGPDNRMVGPGGWITTMNADHDTEWHPPPTLDTGQNRINHYHHPERLRTPDENTWTPDVPASRARAEAEFESAEAASPRRGVSECRRPIRDDTVPLGSPTVAESPRSVAHSSETQGDAEDLPADHWKPTRQPGGRDPPLVA